METTLISSATNQREQDMFRTLSLTALLAGTLDMSAAIVQVYFMYGHGSNLKPGPDNTPQPVSFLTYLTHGGPDRICKSIASGIFGSEATSGGVLMAAWGLVIHFMIAFLFTAFLFLIYPVIAKAIKNKFIIAILYGLFIWAVMNLIVVPLSISHKLPSIAWKTLIDEGILTCMIGLPVALIAHRYYSRKRAL
jgi:hypothetical protein